MIKKPKEENGNTLEGMDALKPHIKGCFSNLFTSEVNFVDPAIINKVQTKVTDQMNVMLMAPYTADDVRKAVFSIGDLKAPGPDGLHAIFFKNIGAFWEMR